jgi:hypothetical protein
VVTEEGNQSATLAQGEHLIQNTLGVGSTVDVITEGNKDIVLARVDGVQQRL